jgi:isopentenyl-diphosphate delta-isomerase
MGKSCYIERMTDPTNKRKFEHIRIIKKDQRIDRKKTYFDRIHLIHRALPELDLKDIDPSVMFMGKRLSFPLLISAMTGGDHELLRTINKNLAVAAEANGVAMCVGSQRVMFTQPNARTSFELRPFAPTSLLFANIGAVQLNYGLTISECRQAVDILQADGLYFHLNPLQEAIQPEGNSNFGKLATRIGEVASQLKEPVLVKEVGCGLSPGDVNRLVENGSTIIDVAGSGGTSWGRIENHRQHSGRPDNLGILFQDWGIATPLALYHLKPFRDQITLIASGGLRSGLDMVKAMILGASLCGMALPFLKAARESAEAVIKVISRLKKEFVTAMFLTGSKDVQSLFCNETLLLNTHIEIN